MFMHNAMFMRNARREAKRDGALSIDLVGDDLADKLKELGWASAQKP